MPRFSSLSLKRLATCDERLQKICHELIKTYDFSVREGHRGKAAQDAAVKSGASQAPWPTSKHNSMPSRAVDIYPYPFPGWRGAKADAKWQEQREKFLACAKKLKIPIHTISWDMPHFQLDPVGRKKKK